MIDTTNWFAVGLMGEKVIILHPPRGAITPDEALNLAAYLVSLSEFHASHSFQAVRDAVEAT